MNQIMALAAVGTQSPISQGNLLLAVVVVSVVFCRVPVPYAYTICKKISSRVSIKTYLMMGLEPFLSSLSCGRVVIPNRTHKKILA